jgi:peroxiredoxin
MFSIPRVWRQFLLLSLFFSIGWIIYTTFHTSQRIEKNFSVPEIGFQAPDFILTDIEGEIYQLKSLKGSAVVLNIWASWCNPCQAEMPAIQDVYEQYSNDNVVILGINDTRQDSISAVLDFVESNNLTFPILLDYEGSVSKNYQVQALPTTFFINPQGIIEEIVIGGPMSEALLEIRIKELIGVR